MAPEFVCDVSGKQHFGKETVAVARGQVALSLADAVSPLSVSRCCVPLERFLPLERFPLSVSLALLCNTYPLIRRELWART